MENIITHETKICIEGTKEWKKIEDFPLIYKYFKSVENESLEINEKAEEDALEVFDELKKIEEAQKNEPKIIQKQEIINEKIQENPIEIEIKEESKEEIKDELKEEEKNKKRKNKKEKKQKKKKKVEKGWIEPKYKTNIYVSGIPSDFTMNEFTTLFSKYGVLKVDPETQEPKAKLYKNDDGTNKGDGVIHYMREDSVNLAIQFLDNYEVKPGHSIHVEIAEFKQKDGVVKKKYVPVKKKKDHRLNWGIEKGRSHEQNLPNIVILKNMFSLSGFSEDPLFEHNLKDDIKGECEKFGQIDKVRVFKKNPEGIIEIRFQNSTSAKNCVDALNGRYFDGKKIEVSLWDFKTKYNQFEDEDDEEERYEKFVKNLNQKEMDDNIDKVKE